MQLNRISLTTASGAILGLLACFASSRVSASHLPWYGAMTTIVSFALMGFAIGVSSLPMRWWSHGLALGFAFSLPLAFTWTWANNYWAPKHLLILVGGTAAGLAIEGIKRIFLTDTIASGPFRPRSICSLSAISILLIAGSLYSFSPHWSARERLTLGQFTEAVEREHIARYTFAKPFCIGKAVADIASGTGYGSTILRDVAASVDAYDKEDFGGNYIIDLEKKSWVKHYDVIVSFETIEHLANPEIFLENAQRTTALLVLSTPINERKGANPFHKQVWSVGELKTLLERFFECEYCFQDRENIVRRPLDRGFLVAVCKPRP